MQVIPMHQAKSNLSSLIKRAANGETLLVGAYGRAEAMITPISTPPIAAKKIGILAGQLIVPDDFNTPLPEAILSAFEGS